MKKVLLELYVWEVLTEWPGEREKINSKIINKIVIKMRIVSLI